MWSLSSLILPTTVIGGFLLFDLLQTVISTATPEPVVVPINFFDERAFFLFIQKALTDASLSTQLSQSQIQIVMLGMDLIETLRIIPPVDEDSFQTGVVSVLPHLTELLTHSTNLDDAIAMLNTNTNVQHDALRDCYEHISPRLHLNLAIQLLDLTNQIVALGYHEAGLNPDLSIQVNVHNEKVNSLLATGINYLGSYFGNSAVTDSHILKLITFGSYSPTYIPSYIPVDLIDSVMNSEGAGEFKLKNF